MKHLPNLSDYDIKQLLRNPGLIHQIQDNLAAIKDDSLIGTAIRDGAISDINGTIQMVIDQYPHNPPVIKRIVGIDTLRMIEDFAGITLADNLKDVNI